jgi:trehalose 6-phosphate phosphatase
MSPGPADPHEEGYAAFLFDLDGVVTNTAQLHAAAWKQLFDEYLAQRTNRRGKPYRAFGEEDYRRFIDGMPRYEGVRSFLVSRKISLPHGDPADPPDRETICGLGNRKNRFFQEQLADSGVEVFETSVAFIRELRRQGVKTALVSSSKNASAVLDAAGLKGIFDVRIDGVEAERLSLAGKPRPDTFLEAARRLETPPQHSVVIEDAIAGVAAGRAGGFGLVIGIDRTGVAAAMKANGAHIVVEDLAELELRPIPPIQYHQTADLLPDALSCTAGICALFSRKRPAVFLDYDGTLTPIVARPELAVLSAEMRGILADLASHCHVAIVSGRDRAEVARLVGLDGLVYAGSHGFDIAGPDGLHEEHEGASAFLSALDRAEALLQAEIGEIEGVLLERKKFAIAVHYRLVARRQITRIKRAAETAAERHGLRQTTGKKVFELRPDMAWDKGKAVLWLLSALDLEAEDVVPLYVGDDDTDEDAFAALSGRGIGILVTNADRHTLAQYKLSDTQAVEQFLGSLSQKLARRG